MMENKRKKNEKRSIPLRTSGEIIAPVQRPSQTLFTEVARQIAEEELTQLSSNTESLPTLSSHTTPSRHSTQTRGSLSTEIAPTRNFQKVPNSITKNAIPEGFFVGKSKQLYDVLYSLTRGAIEPKRAVRTSKTKLMKQSGIGSRITFDTCVNRLENVGLLQITVFSGEHEGNEFEVFTYEETMTRQGSHSSHGSHAQKLDTLLSLESSQTSQSLNAENKDVYKAPNTLFKTNTIDDEFTSTLNEYCIKTTGRELTEKDRAGLKEIAKILGAEILLARARTGNISTFIPFMIAHLKSKFATEAVIGKGEGKKGYKTKRDKVGETSNELNLEKELQVLRDLTEIEGTEGIEKWQNNYSAEDWKWLMENLL